MSSTWPYRYDAYRGYIHLSVEGNCIRQRNVFLYPPQSPELCTGAEDEVKGYGLLQKCFALFADVRVRNYEIFNYKFFFELWHSFYGKATLFIPKLLLVHLGV